MYPNSLLAIVQSFQAKAIVNFEGAGIVNGVNLEVGQVKPLLIRIRRGGTDPLLSHSEGILGKIRRYLAAPQRQIFVDRP
jgi:hypothetical protein